MAAALAGGCRFGSSAPDGSGTIESTQVQVAPLVAGRIAELYAQEGQALKKGDRVAHLDEMDYALKLAEARALLVQSQAALDLLKAGSRDEDILAAREQVREAEASSAAAAADFERIRSVFEKQSVSRKQLDDAKALADRTAAALAAAKQNLAKIERGARPEELRMAEAAAVAAQARVAQLEKVVADCTVTAPMDGTVTTKNREAGEFAAAGASLVTLSRLDEVWLSIYVPEPRLAGVRIGQAAFVRVDGSDERYPGKVTFVSPEAEFTPRNVQTADERAKLVYRVKITLANPKGVFKPGMPADGYLREGP